MDVPSCLVRLATFIGIICFSCFYLVDLGRAETNATIHFLRSQVPVDSQGIFLDQVAAEAPGQSLPHLRLGDAPTVGRTVILTRAQIQAVAQAQGPELTNHVWSGAEQVRVTRRTRMLAEDELKLLLTSLLQREAVRDRGELELSFPRRWLPVAVPDEPWELRVVELPASGVSASFILRFELRTAKETMGQWQVVAQARLWREVYVAATTLKRGQLVGPNDLLRERRDLLGMREALVSLPAEETALELTENITAGAPLSMRSVRLRPVVHRGDLIEALLQDGALSISLRVEVLEEGACGQAVRVRNPVSRREFRGKVQNEQTILVVL